MDSHVFVNLNTTRIQLAGRMNVSEKSNDVCVLTAVLYHLHIKAHGTLHMRTRSGFQHYITYGPINLDKKRFKRLKNINKGI